MTVPDENGGNLPEGVTPEFLEESIMRARKRKEEESPEQSPGDVVTNKVVESSPDLLARRELSDRILVTLEAARSHVARLTDESDGITIPVDIGEKQSEEANVEVSRAAAVSLLATASIALHWKEMSERDPLSAVVAEADKLLEELPGQGHVSVKDLSLKNEIWAALSPLCAEKKLLELLEIPIPARALRSTQRFHTEALYGTPEFRQIGAIVRATLVRLQELGGHAALSLFDQMQTWKQWERNLVNAQPDSAPIIRRIYENNMIPLERLDQLSSTSTSSRRLGKDWVASHGGYLHNVSDDYVQWMIENTHTTLVCEDVSDINTAFGYYSVAYKNETVAALMAELCGYQPSDERYRAEKLPTVTFPKPGEKPMQLQWYNNDDAANLLNAMRNDEVAVSVEIAIDPSTKSESANTTEALRKVGAATALKHHEYSHLQEAGKSMILLRYFEIIEVNGQRIDPVTNVPSRRFIEALGGRLLGSAREEFDSRGTKLKVIWHYWVTDVDDAIQTIEGKMRKAS